MNVERLFIACACAQFFYSYAKLDSDDCSYQKGLFDSLYNLINESSLLADYHKFLIGEYHG